MVTEAEILEDLVETAEQALCGSVIRNVDDSGSCEEIQLETLRTCLEDPVAMRHMPGDERLENLREELIVIDQLLTGLKKHTLSKNGAKIRKYLSKYPLLFYRLPNHPDVQRAKEFVEGMDIRLETQELIPYANAIESPISDSSTLCSSPVSDRDTHEWDDQELGCDDSGIDSLEEEEEEEEDNMNSIQGVQHIRQSSCNATTVNNTPLQQRPPYVISSQCADEGVLKWLGLKKIDYIDPEGNAREWEMCYRPTREGSEPGFGMGKAGGVDAVYIIARCYGKAASPEGVVLEFPAGLVDKGESLEEAALRELREETGYIGKVTGVSPPLFTEPGMSNAVSAVVEIRITGKMDAANDECEFIQVHRVREDELLKGVDKLAHDEGMLLDGPVWLYALAACASAGLALMVGGGYPISLQGSRRRQIT